MSSRSRTRKNDPDAIGNAIQAISEAADKPHIVITFDTDYSVQAEIEMHRVTSLMLWAMIAFLEKQAEKLYQHEQMARIPFVDTSKEDETVMEAKPN